MGITPQEAYEEQAREEYTESIIEEWKQGEGQDWLEEKKQEWEDSYTDTNFVIKSQLFKRLISVFPGLMVGLTFIVAFFLGQQNSRIDKTKLLDDFDTMINNGASLEVIQEAYDARKEIRRLFYRSSNYVPFDTPLSKLLSELRFSIYGSDSVRYKSTAVEIAAIIQDQRHTDPFDNLNSSQREYFDNIRIKLGSEYPTIEQEVRNISSIVYEKTQLTGKYLKRSNLALIFALVGVLLSIGTGIWSAKTNRSLSKIAASKDDIDSLKRTLGIRFGQLRRFIIKRDQKK